MGQNCSCVETKSKDHVNQNSENAAPEQTVITQFRNTSPSFDGAAMLSTPTKTTNPSQQPATPVTEEKTQPLENVNFEEEDTVPQFQNMPGDDFGQKVGLPQILTTDYSDGEDEDEKLTPYGQFKEKVAKSIRKMKGESEEIKPKKALFSENQRSPDRNITFGRNSERFSDVSPSFGIQKVQAEDTCERVETESTSQSNANHLKTKRPIDLIMERYHDD